MRKAHAGIRIVVRIGIAPTPPVKSVQPYLASHFQDPAWMVSHPGFIRKVGACFDNFAANHIPPLVTGLQSSRGNITKSPIPGRSRDAQIDPTGSSLVPPPAHASERARRILAPRASARLARAMLSYTASTATSDATGATLSVPATHTSSHVPATRSRSSRLQSRGGRERGSVICDTSRAWMNCSNAARRISRARYASARSRATSCSTPI